MKKMFKSKKDVFNFILGLILLIFLGYIAYKIAILFADTLKKLFDNYPTVAVALVTGFLAFISAIVGKVVENKFFINNQIRKERQEIYINFLDWLVNNVLYAEISNSSNIVSELREQQKRMTIYASDNVLKAWATFKNISMNSVLNKQGMSKEEKTKYYFENEAPYIEKLILAIRKELGYKNKNIKQYDILKLYINDINEYL